MPVLKQSFKAWIDKQPGGPHKLIVVGEYEAPTGGWKVTLQRAVPQGINADIIILEVKAIKPTGTVTQMVTNIPLRYEESPPQNSYKNATIRSDGSDFTIPVTETQ